MRGEADAALARGLALEAGGRPNEAFAEFQRAASLDPSNGRAWRQLGNLLRQAGQLGLASDCFERAIAADDDPALNAFFLSAVGVGAVVPSAPASFVTALFDQYAERFDAHLTGELGYRAPERLAELIARHGAGAVHADSLDLGCGTGLAGQALRGSARRLTGVDLSPRMLARAEATGAYTRLVEADLSAHLQATPDRHDLVLCSDVFIYVGELGPLFDGVRRVLKPGGAFAFTVEACEADAGFDLLPTLRYAHSERYVRALAAEHGFEVFAIERDGLREQDGTPVEGFYVYLVA